TPVDFIGAIGDKNTATGIVPALIMKKVRVKMKGDYHSRMDKIKEAIDSQISREVQAGILDENSGKNLKLKFIPGLDYGMLENVDMVIDLEDGDLEQKQKTLKDVESMTEANSVFAVSTSHLSIDEIIGHAAHPEKVVGVRYGSPDSSVPLVEIIPTPGTQKSIIATMIDFVIRQEKTWILVKDNPGFYLGRLQAVYLNEALGLLYHGGNAGMIDKVMEERGFAQGPFKVIDEMGFREVERIINTLYAHPDPGPKPRTIYSLHGMIQADYAGRENAKGFYIYDKKTIEREEVNDAIYEFWRETPRREITSEEIYGRLFYEVVNEAVHCLAEGVIQSPEDGDLGAVLGFGFPRFLGGPFRYIDSKGISEMIGRLEACEQDWGKAFHPPGLLKEMGEKGTKFYE
ncbi:MAG: hypothetical protein KDD99_28760, partial [Bacteroidetes bacterium]|nr:hypothetical protein [Bacteroidota bacterium]